MEGCFFGGEGLAPINRSLFYPWYCLHSRLLVFSVFFLCLIQGSGGIKRQLEYLGGGGIWTRPSSESGRWNAVRG